MINEPLPCLSFDLTILLRKQEHYIYISSSSQKLHQCLLQIYSEMETVGRVSRLRKENAILFH